MTIGRGVYTYTPDPAMTGHLKSIQAPDNGLLTYSYKSGWLETTTWSGTVAGSVTKELDDNLRIGSVSVSQGQTIHFVYDSDGLLTQIGNLVGLTPGVFGPEVPSFASNKFQVFRPPANKHRIIELASPNYYPT